MFFLKKEGNTHKKANDLDENYFTRFIISKNPIEEISSPNLKNTKFCCFFFQKKDQGCVFIRFFLGGWLLYQDEGPRKLVEGPFKLKLRIPMK